MKYLLCPDSYKEAADAVDISLAMARGLRKASPNADCDLAPLSDGGEGFVKAMLASGGDIIQCEVVGPLGSLVKAHYGMLPDGLTAIIEMAAAAGLSLVPQCRRNPLKSTTFGVGQLISSALDNGACKLIIGIGGSATCDGGAGMAQALGAGIYDSNGLEIGFGGAELRRIAQIDMSGFDSRLMNCEIVVACDIDNPLTGPNGSAAVFGPQKGASPEDIDTLDEALTWFEDCIDMRLGVKLQDVQGVGAAGGLGAGLLAFCGARLESGFNIVADSLRLRERMATVDWVVTGEGKTDDQSLMGKAVGGVVKMAGAIGRPCIVLSGSIDGGCQALFEAGATALLSISDRPMDIVEAQSRSISLVEHSAFSLGRLLESSGK